MSTRGLFQRDDQRTGDADRRTNTFQRLAEQVKTYAIVGTVAGALFAGGYNWRGVRDLEGEIVGVRGEVHRLAADAVKKDVLAEQLKVLSTAMDGLRRELELMREDHQRERRQQ